MNNKKSGKCRPGKCFRNFYPEKCMCTENIESFHPESHKSQREKNFLLIQFEICWKVKSVESSKAKREKKYQIYEFCTVSFL